MVCLGVGLDSVCGRWSSESELPDASFFSDGGVGSALRGRRGGTDVDEYKRLQQP